MILSDETIIQMRKGGTLYIEPLSEEQIQPASVDIRLGDTFSIVEDTAGGIITMDSEIKYKTIKTDKYLCYPGSLCLPPLWSLLGFPKILRHLWRVAALSEEWGFLFKMQGGLTRDLKEKSHWSCLMPIVAQSSYSPGEE